MRAASCSSSAKSRPIFPVATDQRWPHRARRVGLRRGIHLVVESAAWLTNQTSRSYSRRSGLRLLPSSGSPSWRGCGRSAVRHSDSRIGIEAGHATLGRIGFEGRYDYGALGPVTNLASRLSTRAAAGQILIGQRLFAAVDEAVDTVPVGELELKGFAGRSRRTRSEASVRENENRRGLEPKAPHARRAGVRSLRSSGVA